MPRLEVCVADAESLVAAVAGGADRIELCAALEVGGITPSPGLMRLAARVPVPVYAMVRPRSGDFVFGPADVDAMLAEIDAIRAVGLAGVVLGASRPNGELDVAVLRRLRQHATGLGSTLHRAIDLVPDIAEAVEAAVELGFERVLTSGGAATALEGAQGIRAALAAARGRIAVMAGAGLNPANAAQLLRQLVVDELHSSCAVAQPTAGEAVMRLGFAAGSRRVTSVAVVRAMKRAIAGTGPASPGG